VEKGEGKEEGEEEEVEEEEGEEEEGEEVLGMVHKRGVRGGEVIEAVKRGWMRRGKEGGDTGVGEEGKVE